MFCRKYTLFARLSLSNSSFCWIVGFCGVLLAFAFHGLPTHRFKNCKSQALSPSRRLTQRCLHCTCWRQHQNFISADTLVDKNSSHPPHVQLDTILRMVSSQAHLSKWHNFSSVVLVPDRTLRHSPSSLHLKVVDKSCTISCHPVHQHVMWSNFCLFISERRLLEMSEADPELSNSLVLHDPSSLSSLLTLQARSDLWIDTVWSKHLSHQECLTPGHISILSLSNPTDRCNFENSASHNRPDNLFLLATTAKIDSWIESVETIIEIFDHQTCLLQTRNHTQSQECAPDYPLVCRVFRQGSWPSRRSHIMRETDNVRLHGTDVPLWVDSSDFGDILTFTRSNVFWFSPWKSCWIDFFLSWYCCAWFKTRSQYSLRTTGKLIPESLSNFRLSSKEYTPSLTFTSNTQAPLSYIMSNPWVLQMICFTFSIHFMSFRILSFPSGVNTIIESLSQPLCTDRIARFVSVTSKLMFVTLLVLLMKGTLRLMS